MQSVGGSATHRGGVALDIRNEKENTGGQGLVSYTVILLLVAMACVSGLSLFEAAVKALFNRIIIPS